MFINVNGVEWEIKSVPHNSIDLMRHDWVITLGVTDCNLKSVFISDSIRDELLYKVVCHELCHVFIFSYNYYLSEEEEERLAEFISMFGMQILGLTYDIINNLFKTKVS